MEEKWKVKANVTKLYSTVLCYLSNLIYSIICSVYKKIYVGETGRKPRDPFVRHFRDVQNSDLTASKTVTIQSPRTFHS